MIIENLEPGAIITAKVSRIENYGVFFDYANGTTILVLITEMKEDGIVEHPSNLVTVGEDVELRILRYNEENKAYAATMVI